MNDSLRGSHVAALGAGSLWLTGGRPFIYSLVRYLQGSLYEISSTHCFELLLFLLRELHPRVGGGADAHQAEKTGAELRHGQCVVDGHDEDDHQHDAP